MEDSPHSWIEMYNSSGLSNTLSVFLEDKILERLNFKRTHKNSELLNFL